MTPTVESCPLATTSRESSLGTSVKLDKICEPVGNGRNISGLKLPRHQRDSLRRSKRGIKHQRSRSMFRSVSENINHAASETFLVAGLTVKLLEYLGLGFNWFSKFLWLMAYAALLMPGFLQAVLYYFLSGRVRRSVIYGPMPRNRLDLYLPSAASSSPSNRAPQRLSRNSPQKSADVPLCSSESTESPVEGGGGFEEETTPTPLCPVVIFVTGGAWIIGYKAWGTLVGWCLQERGVVVACLDYRNFPQGSVSDMVTDISTGVGWVVNNIAGYGGDPSRVFLMGQSAGAHLSALALVKQSFWEANEKEQQMEGMEQQPLEQEEVAAEQQKAQRSEAAAAPASKSVSSSSLTAAALTPHSRATTAAAVVVAATAASSPAVAPYSLSALSSSPSGLALLAQDDASAIDPFFTASTQSSAERETAPSLSVSSSSSSLSSSTSCSSIPAWRSQLPCGWRCSDVQAFFGVSGCYNLQRMLPHFDKRGLHRSLFLSIMEGESSLEGISPQLLLSKASPAVTSAARHLPRIFLTHGTGDISVPYEESTIFSETLKAAGVAAHVTLYPGKSHTDLILQDPMRGGRDELLEDVLAIVTGRKLLQYDKSGHHIRPRMVPEFLIVAARIASPF